MVSYGSCDTSCVASLSLLQGSLCTWQAQLRPRAVQGYWAFCLSGQKWLRLHVRAAQVGPGTASGTATGVVLYAGAPEVTGHRL